MPSAKGAATVYSKPDCGTCHRIIDELKRSGWAVTVLDLAEAADWDQEVWKQLDAQCGAAPVVRLDGEIASMADVIQRTA